ncbi:hypothetical protein BDV41DRAFT_528949 [Aspergillus transmontanensis]|uniref:Uncharacterized protein n=1 Tax=Aspergillus transmontanensis TaxID=1034304 RepID=A0A5N6W993_9EURO|nr:hypothetical protein BDV41DRAFT_528949 [Aspergillus transmontanensis]
MPRKIDLNFCCVNVDGWNSLLLNVLIMSVTLIDLACVPKPRRIYHSIVHVDRHNMESISRHHFTNERTCTSKTIYRGTHVTGGTIHHDFTPY